MLLAIGEREKKHENSKKKIKVVAGLQIHILHSFIHTFSYNKKKRITKGCVSLENF